MLTHEQATQVVLSHLPHLKGELTFTKLCGLTNVTYSVNLNKSPQYVLKSFSDGFDRETQNQIVRQLAEQKLAARVIFANNHYRIEEFISSLGHPSNDDLKNPILLQKILVQLHYFHSVKITETKGAPLFLDYLWSQAQLKDLIKYENSQNVPAYQSLKTKIMQVLDHQSVWKRKLMPDDASSVRFCHNDLNNLNILLGKDQIHFIDYDYVGYNYLGYDIANFLNEACIDYTVANYPGFSLQRRYSCDEIVEICRGYPGWYEGLGLQVLKFFCVCNLYWAVWSLKRYQLNKTSTFGILEHGLMRMQLFQYYNLMVEHQIVLLSEK